MQFEISVVKIRMILEAEVEVRNPDDMASLEKDLTGHLMKVKSGIYENQFYGDILSVERLSTRTEIEEVDDDDVITDNTEATC